MSAPLAEPSSRTSAGANGRHSTAPTTQPSHTEVAEVSTASVGFWASAPMA